MISTEMRQTEATNADVLFLQPIFNYLLPKGSKTYNYTHYQCGVDYFFEVTVGGTQAYMTGQGRGIKPNDYLLLQVDARTERYQVESIDYYACPSDMWLALLKRAPEANQ